MNAISPPRERLHLVLMLALTFSTGIIDAVGYLGLDRVFTGNMTGNVVILGMALVGADDLPVLGPAIALVTFFVGALIGGSVLRGSRAGWNHRKTALFLTVGGILAASGGVIASGTRDSVLLYAVTGALGLAMGIQASAARRLAVKDVTTVVVTSTLTGLAADLRFATQQDQPWARRLIAVGLIGLGALVGAWCVHQGADWGVALSAVITITVALCGHLTKN